MDAARKTPAQSPAPSGQNGKRNEDGCDVTDELAAGSPIDGRPGDPRSVGFI